MPAEWQEAVVDKEYFDSGQRMRESKGWSLCSCSSAMERCVLSLPGLSPVSTRCRHAHQSKLQAAHGSLKDPSEHKDLISPQCRAGSVKWLRTQIPLPLRGQAASWEQRLPNWPRTAPHQQTQEIWVMLSEEVKEWDAECMQLPCGNTASCSHTPSQRAGRFAGKSRNYLINTSYSSNRKLSPKPTGFPKVIILTVIYFYNKLTNRTPSPFAFCVIFIILLGGTM